MPHQEPKKYQNRAPGSNFDKKLENPFFRQFPWLDMGIYRPKNPFNWPNIALNVSPVRYFDGQVGFHRFLGSLDVNNQKKMRKKSKNPFFRPHSRTSRSLQSAKNLTQELNCGTLWVPGGALGYAKLFPNVCWCFPGN